MSGRDGFGAERGSGRGRGRYAAGLRPVSESERISIADQIEAFQISDATGVCTSPPHVKELKIVSPPLLR